MRLVTVSGPPASGKTAVILKALGALPGYRAGVVKFDCLSTFDDEKYRRAGYGAAVGVSGSLCPGPLLCEPYPGLSGLGTPAGAGSAGL